MELLAIVVCAAAFTVSASAGFGGSLLLVPALSLLLGTKEGVALAALLLACHNVVKLVVYRRAIPVRECMAVIVLTTLGATAGARLFVGASEDIVSSAVVVAIVLAFASESLGLKGSQRLSAPVLALLAGVTSGFAGTSGPLKGLALRALSLDRFQLVGAASAVSLAGDLAKSLIFLEASLLGERSYAILIGAAPLMPLAAIVGRRVNARLGERAYATMFWTVMAGYAVRVLLR
jgi:uncharacterized membrane protein YfcA